MRFSLLLLLTLAAPPAFAQHEHVADEASPTAAFAAGVSVVAASFENMQYAGNYQGVVPSVRWASGGLAVIGTGSAYRLEKNGASFYAVGDAAVHGQARLVTTHAFDAGVALGVSLPTGNARHGTGMGHVMLMPAVFGGWSAARVRVAASLGYSRALVGDSHEDHGGPWPLVAPMLPSEVSWHGGVELLVVDAVTAGARASGGIPVGDGNARAIVGGRVVWRARTVESAFELQAGIAGDPFTVRGVVSTALTF